MTIVVCGRECVNTSGDSSPIHASFKNHQILIDSLFGNFTTPKYIAVINFVKFGIIHRLQSPQKQKAKGCPLKDYSQLVERWLQLTSQLANVWLVASIAAF